MDVELQLPQHNSMSRAFAHTAAREAEATRHKSAIGVSSDSPHLMSELFTLMMCAHLRHQQPHRSLQVLQRVRPLRVIDNMGIIAGGVERVTPSNASFMFVMPWTVDLLNAGWL